MIRAKAGRRWLAAAGLLALLLTSCEEGFFEDTTVVSEVETADLVSEVETADLVDDVWPVEIHYQDAADVNELWLITYTPEETERQLLMEDLIPFDGDVWEAFQDGTAVLPDQQADLHLDLARTPSAPESPPYEYWFEFVQQQTYFAGQAVYFEEPVNSGLSFIVGENHFGEGWELLRETVFLYNKTSIPVSRFEQVYRGPDGELYVYRPGQSLDPLQWEEPVPMLLEDLIAQGYTAYDYVDFGGPIEIEQDPTAGDCPINDADLVIYSRNLEIPDVVERWAPIIYQDIDQDNTGADYITSVDFDGNWRGSDNAAHWSSYPLPGVVYYSLVRGGRHDFIGYYFYHAEDTTGFLGGGGHEHDFEGIMVTVNRCTNQVDSLVANQHGNYIPYVAASNQSWPNGVRIKTATNEDYGLEAFFTLQERHFSVSGVEHTYETLAVGVEANTHAVWGMWYSFCVVGPAGRAGWGCDNSHGGDGIIYSYDDYPQVPDQPLLQYPNWPTNSYALVDIAGLWDFAHLDTSCGQDGDTHLYRCEGTTPWDTLNGADTDAGNLPWTWGVSGVIGHVCDAPSMLLDPAAILDAYFEYPPGDYSPSYLSNRYAATSTCS